LLIQLEVWRASGVETAQAHWNLGPRVGEEITCQLPFNAEPANFLVVHVRHDLGARLNQPCLYIRLREIAGGD
jgi:hypothetical protein